MNIAMFWDLTLVEYTRMKVIKLRLRVAYLNV